MYGIDCFFFQGCLPSRAGFTSPARPYGAEGATRETDSIFSTLRARREGHGERARVRIATGGPRSILCRSRRAAPRSTWQGRRENGPPVDENTISLCDKVPLGGVGYFPRGDASWHATGGNYQSPSRGTCRSMRVTPNERDI